MSTVTHFLELFQQKPFVFSINLSLLTLSFSPILYSLQIDCFLFCFRAVKFIFKIFVSRKIFFVFNLESTNSLVVE